MTPSPTPPTFTHWLWWADSELAHITTHPDADGWLLRLSAASVGRCPVPVAAPPTGMQGLGVVWGTVPGVVMHALALPGAAPETAIALDGCMGRIAHGRWVGASGVPQSWWPLVWPGEEDAWPPSGVGVLELAFSNGAAFRLTVVGLRAELPCDAVLRESMAC
jgi:hypothetical protein